MRSVVFFTLILTAHASATADQAAPIPTAFESFIADPKVIVEREQWVGSIDSADATVSVTVLVGHDTADASRRMQGVRLTMQDNAGGDVAYLDHSQIASALQDLADVEGGKAFMRTELDAPYRVMGTAACWMPKRPVRILCPSYRIGPDWSGLLLAAYGGRAYEFPGRKPAELAMLLRNAATVLESGPPSA